MLPKFKVAELKDTVTSFCDVDWLKSLRDSINVQLMNNVGPKVECFRQSLGHPIVFFSSLLCQGYLHI